LAIFGSFLKVVTALAHGLSATFNSYCDLEEYCNRTNQVSRSNIAYNSTILQSRLRRYWYSERVHFFNKSPTADSEIVCDCTPTRQLP